MKRKDNIYGKNIKRKNMKRKNNFLWKVKRIFYEKVFKITILWVDDERKWKFKTMTVTQIEKVTKIIVNKRYFPSKGTTRLVG